MLPTLPITLLCLALAQDPAATPPPATPSPSPAPAPAPAEDSKGGWKELDKVVMIVNQDIIPKGRMLRDLEEFNKRRPIRDPNEMKRAQSEIQTAHLKQSLAAQAGQDMGIDEKLVDRIVSDRIDRMIQDRNGVVGMSAVLESKGTTTQELRRMLREQLYGDVWEETVTGKGAGAAARPSQDRFVRPGLRKFHYENAIRHPEALVALGGRPETWKLQVLVLDCAALGGVQATRALAAELKTQIEAGASMDEIVQRYVPGDKDRGVVEVPAAQMQTRDAAIAAFASSAPEESLSDPVTFENAKGTYVRLVRLLRRTPAVVPSFTAPDCQSALVKNVQDDLDQYRLDRGYRRLFSAAYIWPEELNQRDARP